LWLTYTLTNGSRTALKMRVLGPPRGAMCDHVIPDKFMVTEVLEIRQDPRVSKAFEFVALKSKTFGNHFDGSPEVGGKMFTVGVSVKSLRKALFPGRGGQKAGKRLVQYYDAVDYLERDTDCDFTAIEPNWWEEVGIHPELDGIAEDEPLSDNGGNPEEDDDDDGSDGGEAEAGAAEAGEAEAGAAEQGEAEAGAAEQGEEDMEEVQEEDTE